MLLFNHSAPQFYEAFKDANLCHPKWFWCTWHVDKAWKNEMRSIKDLHVQKLVYQSARSLLEQLDESIFMNDLDIFLAKLKSSEATKQFYTYFEREWRFHASNWAYWSRKGSGINTNMLCEAFHRVLKYSYLNGKFNKRVDVCLLGLIRYNRDRIFERLIKLTKGKKSHKINLIDSRHKNSLQLATSNLTKISNETFQYSHNGHTYDIQIVSECCSKEVCKLWCVECGFCCHVYKCTCTDFQMNNISCKHIHLAHRKNAENDGCDVQIVDFENDQPTTTTNDIDQLFSLVSQNVHNVEDLKKQVQKELDEISITIQSCLPEDENNLRDLCQKLKAAKHTFLSVRSEPLKQIEFSQKIHPNQSVQAQLRFVSTKKKRKSTSTVVFAKPTIAEKQNIFKNLSFTPISI